MMSSKIKKPKLGQLNIRIEIENIRELEQLAKAEERTISQLGRLAVREFLERRKEMVAA